MTVLLAPERSALSLLPAPALCTLPTAVTENLRHIRAATDARIMAVVKADGYGHGAVSVARTAVDAGAEWLGVTDVAEAVILRDAGLRVPILAWLNPSGIDAAQAAEHRIDVAVGSVEELRQLIADAARPLRVHLQMDTGMSRGGCPLGEWTELLRLARAGRGRVEVVGVMGHLPRADEGDPRANEAAVLRMRQARDAVLRAGFGPVLVHLAATSGVLTDPATHFDMVRIGAGLVGIDPSSTVTLAGASRFTASVVHSSWVPAGTPVGYGSTHLTTRGTHLSVVGVGYADGIPRELGAGAAVEIAGRRCPIVGPVSMDQIVVDTGDTAVPRSAAVTVFGPEGGAVPSVQEWARWAGTIPHTVVTGIGSRVQRCIA
ncbi:MULTISPECIES: alanine racemase [unclassified Microbacterium]|uniref:alanine racemase n=1 Tax=unclassified Microbacterium TaxID=2609290 RepID=UPI000EA85B87|nr:MULTISPECIES: alanine racemase [unclassified Microbacterium]MBT2484352.1 alanine racemase [Microbacterium sp. ISL-108]RKN67266.1 alanine racemase [Microbacterium sp. CGR2]